MSTWILFLLLGLGTGSLYAALAQGVILVYRSSGVVNFALGAMAMFPAVVYAELRTSGDLILPLVIIPSRYPIGAPQGFWMAAFIALLVGATIAVTSYLVIFQRLRDAPALTMVIATVGLTIVLQGLAAKSFGTSTVRTPDVLPRETVVIFGRLVPVDRFWMTAVVVLTAVVLVLIYRYTKFGLLTRAASESPKGTMLLGYDSRAVALVNTVLASVLVGAVGILVTALAGVNPFTYSLFVVPALAAALAGRLRSFGIATFVGLSIGALEALTVHLVARRYLPNFFQGGFSSLVAFVVIVVALVLVGRTLPDRATLLERKQSAAPLPVMNPWLWLCMIGLAVAINSFAGPNVRLALIQSLFVIALLLSYVTITGLVGQVSLAQLSFAGFAAFMLARAAGPWNLPFPLSPLVAIAITTALGALIAIPAVRIRGIQLAIVTIAAALVFEQMIFRSPTLAGQAGIAHVDPPSIFGVDLGIIGGGVFPRRIFGYVALGFTVLSALLVANVRRSSIGRRFLAVRMNERAAAAAGINVVRTKLLGAAIASFLAAVAGVMFAYKSQDFTGGGFEAAKGLQMLALAYLGGIGSIAGAVIGGLLAPAGLVIVALSSAQPSVNQFLLTGFALIFVAVRLPSGLAGLGGPLVARIRHRWNHADPFGAVRDVESPALLVSDPSDESTP